MGHASDCAVNDGPAFLPGPCDCGLELRDDGEKLFRPLLVIGARGARWDIRQRNIEAFVEAEELPVRDGRFIRLSIHLIDAHGWPSSPCVTDRMDLSNSVAVMVGERDAHALSHGFNRDRLLAMAKRILRPFSFGFFRWLRGPASKAA